MDIRCRHLLVAAGTCLLVATAYAESGRHSLPPAERQLMREQMREQWRMTMHDGRPSTERFRQAMHDGRGGPPETAPRMRQMRDLPPAESRETSR